MANGIKMKPYVLIQWVVQAWSQVTKEVIIKSFDVCGIIADNISKPEAEAEAEAEDEEEEHVNMDDMDDRMMDNIVID